MLQKVALEESRENLVCNFLDELWPKIKKVYSQISEETLYIIVQNYPAELINDV